MSNLPVAVRGSVASLDARALAVLFERSSASDPAVRDRTRRIIDRVRAEGDAALLEFAREFDEAAMDSLEVPRAAWRAALDALPAALRRSLERAAANIRQVHEAFRPIARETVTADGVDVLTDGR